MSAHQTWEQAVQWLIEQPDMKEIVRDCYYDQPTLAAVERYAASVEWQEISRLLPKQAGRALDLGAGCGIASYALARSGWQVTALEPDPSELVGGGAIRKLAREAKLDITVLQEFGETIPCEDQSFDLVFARQVLHHARDLPQLCRELHRILLPGGTMLAVRDHVISRREDLPRFLDSHPLHKLYGGENAYLLDEYLGALRAAGFQVQKVFSPLETPINFAPHDLDSLREELLQRLSGSAAMKGLLRTLMRPDALFRLQLGLLSRFDRRPGRLYSFLCVRPVE